MRDLLVMESVSNDAALDMTCDLSFGNRIFSMFYWYQEAEILFTAEAQLCLHTKTFLE